VKEPVESIHRPKLGLNVIANYLGKIWGIVSIYVFIPLYVHLLGIDAYGLIAFNAIVLGILYIADAGLSSTFAREAARVESGQGLLDLLTSIERILFSILFIVGVIFMLTASIISTHWLKITDNLPKELVVQSLWLMGLATLPQIAMSLYLGGLIGFQRQVLANVLWIGFGVVRSGLVIVPIYYEPDIRIFFMWQAIASFGMLIVIRHFLIHHIVKSIKRISSDRIIGKFTWDSVHAVRGYALGMFGMSIIAALNIQLDKIVVSKMLSIAEFAEYYLASALAQIPYIVTIPIAVALLPRITNLLHDNNQSEKITIIYRNATYYIACIGAVSGFGLFFFLTDVFNTWMPSQKIGFDTIQAASLLILGSILLALQLTPFQLSLAYGHQATNLRLGIVSLTISIPFQMIMTMNFGIIGASVPWFIVNLVAFVYLGVVLNRKFPHVLTSKWFIEDNFLPILLAFISMYAARVIADILNVNSFINLLIALIFAMFSFFGSYCWRERGQGRLYKEKVDNK
jgi:O-antigen/teichoic acid export membrane protein